MNREQHDETASAAMDGEADELELRRFLNQVAQDPEARARWARYHIARDVLHQQAITRPALDIASAVSAALTEEEAPAVATKPNAARVSPFLRFGVAASVTVAVMLGARWFNQTDASLTVAAQTPPPATSPSWQVKPAPAAPAVLASFPTTPADAASQPAPVESPALPLHEPRR